MSRLDGLKFRTKMLLIFLMALSIVLLACIYLYFSLQMLIRDSNDLFEKNLEMAAAYQEMGAIQGEIELYLSTSSSDSLLAFYDSMEKIRGSADRMLEGEIYTTKGIHRKNVANMLYNYLDQAEWAIIAKRGRNIDAYMAAYERTVTDGQAITRYIESVMSGELIDSADKYVTISNRIQYATVFNNLLILVVVLFIAIVIVGFSFELTRPITRLAYYARRVSVGDYDIEIPQEKSGEIALLYRAFSLMVVNIRNQIRELQEKARLERSLAEQQMNNLKMKSALRETELLALQSQVNPHFIFNTIHIGAKIAMLQGDHITCTYLENAADIFRYNLKGLDAPVRLREEIDNVCAYVYLLKTRFGDTVSFDLDLGDDPTALDIRVPRMSFQPIVENAYIHGISEMEQDGRIALKVTTDETFVYVTVSDNGDKGISQDTIDELLQTSDQGEGSLKRGNKKGHTTGIGVDNVVRRLRLFFRRDDVVNIVRSQGETRVIFQLPRQSGGKTENV